MYFKTGYYRVVNTEGDPSKYKSQVVMWDTLPNQTIYNDIPRAHDIDHGVYIIDPHEDYCDFYGMATQKGNDRIINVYLTKMDELKKFTHEFTERADKIIQKTAENKIILPFNNDIHDYEFTDSQLLENTSIKLSQRQIEIAHQLLQGYTVKEIAKILQLSPRTVESYLNNLKDKLGCRNKSALIMALLKTIKPIR